MSVATHIFSSLNIWIWSQHTVWTKAIVFGFSSMYMLFKATGKGKRRGEAWIPGAFTPVCWTRIPVYECTLNLFTQMLSRDLKLNMYQPDFLKFSLKLLDLWSSSSQLMVIHFSSISDKNFEKFVYTHTLTHTHTDTHRHTHTHIMYVGLPWLLRW